MFNNNIISFSCLYPIKEAAWKCHVWKKNQNTGKSNKIQRKFHFKQIARLLSYLIWNSRSKFPFFFVFISLVPSLRLNITVVLLIFAELLNLHRNSSDKLCQSVLKQPSFMPRKPENRKCTPKNWEKYSVTLSIRRFVIRL